MMDLGGQGHRVKFMIRDRGSELHGCVRRGFRRCRIRTVLCNVRTPRMNAIAERWIGGCRRELLDRTLIWSQSHLRRILRQYETHHNQHRPHRPLHSGAPLEPRHRTGSFSGSTAYEEQTRAGGTINEYRLVARCGWTVALTKAPSPPSLPFLT